MSDQPTTYLPSAEKLAALGFHHQPQPAKTACIGWDVYRKPWGSVDRLITVFTNGQVFIQQKPPQLPSIGIDHWQYWLPTETFFEQLLDAIGWLPPSYVRNPADTDGLTVAQLLAWPAGIGGVTTQEYLDVRQLMAQRGGFAQLSREQQLIYLVGQANVMVEMSTAVAANRQEEIVRLQQQLGKSERSEGYSARPA